MIRRAADLYPGAAPNDPPRRVDTGRLRPPQSRPSHHRARPATYAGLFPTNRTTGKSIHLPRLHESGGPPVFGLRGQWVVVWWSCPVFVTVRCYPRFPSKSLTPFVLWGSSTGTREPGPPPRRRSERVFAPGSLQVFPVHELLDVIQIGEPLFTVEGYIGITTLFVIPIRRDRNIGVGASQSSRSPMLNSASNLSTTLFIACSAKW